MKKILCPVDSTAVSDRLVKFVGELAKETQSKIYLVATDKKRKEVVIQGSHYEGNDRLDQLHDYLSGIWHVPCSVEEKSVSENSKKLGLLADQYDIMALAISNSDASTIKVNGLDLLKVLHETLAPILLVPDHFSYKKINRLLYAFDYKHEPQPPLQQLQWLADWFGVEVTFLTILQSDISAAEEKRMSDLQASIKKSWNSKNKISFETMTYPDVPKSLENYLAMRKSNDLLVLSVNHHNMLDRLWHKSVVKGLLHLAEHPYVILHK